MYQATSPLMEVRAQLATSTNTDGVLGSGAGGAEIQKRIDEMTVDAFNNSVDFSKLLRRVSINQLAYVWNIASESAAGSGYTNSTFAFYTEGNAISPGNSTKIQQYAACVGYRTDYSLSGLLVASGMGNQIAEEAKYAAEALAVGEERAIIYGSYASGGQYGYANAFAGLVFLMSSNATFGATDTKYGLAMGTSTAQNVSLVAATSSAGGNGTGGDSGGDSLALADLDSAVTLSNKRGAKNHKRAFLCSEERRDEIDQLLQAQQRFIAPSVEIEGGFRVSSYKGIPIIGSRFMDEAGIAFDGSTTNTEWTTFDSQADQAMYLLDLDNIFMVHAGGVNAKHVPIVGDEVSAGTPAGFNGRSDAVGGYFKSYGALIVKRFDTQVLIYNLVDI